jgi:hypothetical protein
MGLRERFSGYNFWHNLLLETRVTTVSLYYTIFWGKCQVLLTCYFALLKEFSYNRYSPTKDRIMGEKEIPNQEDLSERRRFILIMILIFTLVPAISVFLLFLIGRAGP